MPYQQYPAKYPAKYQSKKPIKSFRDLEVYQKTMECAVLTVKSFQPDLIKQKFPFTENMVNCSMSIPLYVGESNSLRYNDFPLGVATLEKAMAGCNKMVVYYEQAKGLYGDKIDSELADDLIRRYMECRNKMFRLEKAWIKYSREYSGEKVQKIPANY
jgi:hypothetical protein